MHTHYCTFEHSIQQFKFSHEIHVINMSRAGDKVDTGYDSWVCSNCGRGRVAVPRPNFVPVRPTPQRGPANA